MWPNFCVVLNVSIVCWPCYFLISLNLKKCFIFQTETQLIDQLKQSNWLFLTFMQLDFVIKILFLAFLSGCFTQVNCIHRAFYCDL